jgi:hypothetical protein
MKYLIITLTILLFSACSHEPKTSEILQTNSATIISRDYRDLTKFLLKYKKILDLRNPSLWDKKLSHRVIFDITHNLDTIKLLKNNSYKSYLFKAFAKETKKRNDYLILGLYKMFYNSYHIKGGHHITALGYDVKTFKDTYNTLRVVKWKIANAKDDKGRFLFATWQLNWQLELNKRYHNITIKNIAELPSLKNHKESLLEHQNFNFEIILSLMLDRVKHSLEAMGEEPSNLSISAIKAMIFL